jgi:hypothetical protein
MPGSGCEEPLVRAIERAIVVLSLSGRTIGRAGMVSIGFEKTRLPAVPRQKQGKTTMKACFAALSFLAAVVCLGAASSPVLANDTSAELAIGGLTFTKNADISMESEELRIGLDAVTVRYVFLNRSTKPVTLTVAFPLPDLSLADASNAAVPVGNPLNFVGFSTRIDGKPVSFVTNQQAFVNNKNVTAALTEMGIPVFPVGAEQLKINDLSQDVRTRAVAQGLLVESGTNDKGMPLYDATWTLKTSILRQQSFPPGKPVVVEHRYRTSVGMSFDTILRQGLRQHKNLESEVQRYKSKYCVDDNFLKLVDNLKAADKPGKPRMIERRISYVLATGANWAGPIKDFHLIVDKGRADRIASFCGQDIKETSATQLEMRAADFTPKQDLEILILGPN